MATSLIKINLASSSEIEMLYGVGKVMADQIVKYREKEGYFQGPDDLSKVDGIGSKFAVILATQIDWQVPKINTVKERDWYMVFIYLFFISVMVLVFFNKVLPKTVHFFNNYRSGFTEDWVWLWIYTFLSLAFIFEVTRELCLIFRELTTSASSAILFTKIQLILLGITMTAFILSGLGRLIYYQFYAQNGWNTLLGNPVYICILLSGIFTVITSFPQIILLKYPRLIQSRVIRIMYDSSIIVTAPIIAWYLWTTRSEQPIWLILVLIIFGIFFLNYGYFVIRFGKSGFYFAAEWITIDDAQENKTYWLNWINVRLPNPEQQKALKEALELSYPSKFRSLTGLIVIGAGGWILVTVLSSVVDWFVQNWLNIFIK